MEDRVIVRFRLSMNSFSAGEVAALPRNVVDRLLQIGAVEVLEDVPKPKTDRALDAKTRGVVTKDAGNRRSRKRPQAGEA